MRPVLIAVLAALSLPVSLLPASASTISVRRTSHGVIHVKATDYAGLGYGFGFAYATDNLCQLAEQIVTVRGLRSRYFGSADKGAGNIASDTFVRTRLSKAHVQTMARSVSRDAGNLIRGFVAGYNRYLAATRPALRDPNCRKADWIAPIAVADIFRIVAMKAGSEARFASMIADARPSEAPQTALDRTTRREPAPRAEASNAWAFGGDATETGRALLLANPHFPWSGSNRFYQLHLTIPGQLDVMGATIAPLPIVAIGFTRDVAWTHTVSPAERFTLVRLVLDPADPGRYVVDGHILRLRKKSVLLRIKDGRGRLRKERHTISESIYGPLVTAPHMGLQWGRGEAFALQDANLDNVGQIDTWLAYARAKSVTAIGEASRSTAAMPWLTTIAADRAGNVLFGDFSRSPDIDRTLAEDCKRDANGAAAGMVILDGGRGRCRWSDYVSGVALPSTIRRDYVANSNDSYWLVHAGAPLPRGPALMGGYSTELNFRTRMGFTEIERSLDDLRKSGRGMESQNAAELMFSNRSYAAVTFLDDILRLCARQDMQESRLQRACAVLSAWDRRNDVTSRGAVLFREFWFSARLIKGLFALPFSATDPVNTPRGIRVNDRSVGSSLRAALLGAMARLDESHVGMDSLLGEVQGVFRSGRHVPIPGGPSDEGILNTLQATPLALGSYTPERGTSYVQIVEFGTEGPEARGLLSYGQATDSRSLWQSDQLSLLNGLQFYSFPFLEEEILSDPGYHLLPVPAIKGLHDE